MPPRQIAQRIAKVVLQAVIWSGIAGIVFNSAMILGLFGPVHWANYGPGEETEAVQLPDGRYAILLQLVMRVQIYSPNMQFLYGWNIGPSESEQIRLADDGNLNLYAQLVRHDPQGWAHKVYDLNGNFILKDVIPVPSGPVNPAKLPGSGPQPVTVPGGSPWWWTFPFRNGVYGFATLFGGALVGIIASYIFYTPEERQAYRARMRNRRRQPGWR